MVGRLDKIRNKLAEKNLDAVLVTNFANIIYLTNFDFLSPTEREAYIVITKDKQYIISSFLYKSELLKAAPDVTFLEISTAKKTAWWEYVAEIVENEKLGKIGFEENDLTVAEYTVLRKHGMNLSPLSLLDIRFVKDEKEIAAITKACQISDAAFEKIQKHIHPGITEKQLAFKLDTFMREEGAEPAFRTIVAFGKNAAVPHHKTDETKLKDKDIILLDFGAKKDTYCSDMTRMIFLGAPSEKEKKAYQTLLTAQQRAYDFLANNKLPIAAKDIDTAARTYLLQHAYPDFPHSLGHSIGIEDHDGFRVSPISPTELVEGMVFSIEPGIYVPNDFGMRIEDIIVLTKKVPQSLTKSPREMIVL